ncbi:MAG: hypothetical protein QXT45_07745 [Candidatus Bilamarchaeaceae archaeon]
MLPTLLLSVFIWAQQPIKVMVIDSGVTPIQELKSYLPSHGIGGFDYSDKHNHGTSMAYLIAYGSPADDPLPPSKVKIESCNIFYATLLAEDPTSSFYWIDLFMIKTVVDKNKWINQKIMQATVACLKRALKENHQYINMSFSGSIRYNAEHELIKELDSRGVYMTMSAGNYKMNLNINCDQYPLCYIKESSLKHSFGIGAGSLSEPCSYSNYASWLQWVPTCDFKVLSNDGKSVVSRGTSGASALYLHGLIKKHLGITNKEKRK